MKISGSSHPDWGFIHSLGGGPVLFLCSITVSVLFVVNFSYNDRLSIKRFPFVNISGVLITTSISIGISIFRSTPPNYEEWLNIKAKAESERVKKIREEAARIADEKRAIEVEKQVRAREAYEKWVKLRAPNQRLFNLHDRVRVGTV